MIYSVFTLIGMATLCSAATARDADRSVTHVFRNGGGVAVIMQSGSARGTVVKVIRGPHGATIIQRSGSNRIVVTQSGPEASP